MAVGAAQNDLDLLKSLLQRSDISSKISKAVAKKRGNHLFKKLVGLAFFDDQVNKS